MIRKILMAAIVAAAGTVGSTAAFAEAPKDILVIGTRLAGIRTLDPAANNARSVSELLSNMYDNLVRLHQDDIKTVQPMLAKSWVVADDGLSITMTLRDDVVFQSGNPLTAEDAAFTIQRVIKLGQVGSGAIAGWGFTPENVDEMVVARDARTLVINLPAPINSDLVLYSLAAASIGIVDKKTVLAHEVDGDLAANWMNSHAAGSGAFILAEWRPGDLVLFNRNDNYWGGAPAMKRVAVRNIPESGNLRLQLEAGDVDIGQYLLAGDLDALSSNAAINIQKVPGFGFYYMALNQKDPDLKKPLVREAFQHAIDWKAYAKTIVTYTGSPWHSVIPKGMSGAPDNTDDRFAYDPELAKSLLAKAGYPDGIKKVLYPSGPNNLPLAEAIQASAKLAGIEFDLVPGKWVKAYRARTYEVIIANSGAKLPDPFAVATQVAYNPDNSDEANLKSFHMWRSAMQNEELNKLVDQSKIEGDPDKRAAIFRQIDQVYATMAPSIILLYQRTDPYVVNAKVSGYQGQSTWTTRWGAVTKK